MWLITAQPWATVLLRQGKDHWVPNDPALQPKQTLNRKQVSLHYIHPNSSSQLLQSHDAYFNNFSHMHSW